MKLYINLALIGLFLCGMIACHSNTTTNNNHETEHAHDHNHDHTHAHSHDHNHDHAHTHNHDHEHDDHDHDQYIHFPNHQIASMGVLHQQVSTQAWERVIRCSGALEAPVTNSFYAVAPTTGRVSFVKPLSIGKNIQQGELLLRIKLTQPNIANPFLKAEAAYTLAKKNLERAQALAKDTLMAQSELARYESEYTIAKTDYEALKANYDGDSYLVKATGNALLQSIQVNDGQYVQTGDPLFKLVQQNTIALHVDVPARYINEYKNITDANFKQPYSSKMLNVKALSGHLQDGSPQLDANRSSYPVCFMFPNTEALPLGAYADVYLKLQSSESVIVVPNTALVEEQGIYFMFIEQEPEYYEKRLVTIGETDGINTQVLEGLNQSERYVSKGAIFLKLAESAAGIPEHSHEH